MAGFGAFFLQVSRVLVITILWRNEEFCISFRFVLHSILYVIYDFAYALLFGVMVNLSPVCFVLCCVFI